MTRALILVLNGSSATTLNELPIPTVHMLAGLGVHGAVLWQGATPTLQPSLAGTEPASGSPFRLLTASEQGTACLSECTPAALLEKLLNTGISENYSSLSEKGQPASTTKSDLWSQCVETLTYEAWQGFMIEDQSLEQLSGSLNLEASEGGSKLDENLGGVLGVLDEQTAVLLLAPPKTPGLDMKVPATTGFFALVDPGGRLTQPTDQVTLTDLIISLSTICNWGPLTSLEGRSLLRAGDDSESELSEAQEEILRERLSGLGYLG